MVILGLGLMVLEVYTFFMNCHYYVFDQEILYFIINLFPKGIQGDKGEPG